ncbi:EF-hand domain-containing protein [Cohaesibacter intestini]|uniref:EF-hand domain-containing protein n=1 Tax=Cohaesibacter intestini TaxID=2211145 RepID=UPI0018E56585|nr:EF-hand domain-containing protein [Cohaesibacter intestini]
MKNFSKIALAVALIGGVSATALSLDTASARGWNDRGPQQGQNFMGPRGGFKGGPRGMGPEQRIQQFDINKDGVLTKEELATALEQKITDNDTDGDKAITLEEFKTEWAKQTERMMVRAYQRLDPNGDGKVTLEELQQQSSFMFDRMDRNDDGKIDKDDRPQQRMGKRGGRWGDDDGRRGGRHGGRWQQGNMQQGPNGPQFGQQNGRFGPQNGQFGQQNSQFGPKGFGPGFGPQAPQGPQTPQAQQAPQPPLPPLAQVN